MAEQVTSATPLSIRTPLCRYFSPDEPQLMAELRWCFNFFPRPRDTCISPTGKSELPFLLLPHGAICDSGPLVANALLEMDARTFFFRKQEKGGVKDSAPSYRTVVLIGTEHECTAHHFLCLGGFSEWCTPFGKVHVDAELFRQLSTALPVETQPFINEHSIENQLPFLQFMAKERNVVLRILPISVRGTVTPEEFNGIIHAGRRTSDLMDTLARILQEYSEAHAPVAVLATSDYSHVGPSYGVVPPRWPQLGSESIPDFIRRVDEPILRAVMTNYVETLYQVGRQTSMCGLGAALVWMQLGRLMKQVDRRHGRNTSVRLLKYCVGCDIGPPHNDQTGFATFIIS